MTNESSIDAAQALCDAIAGKHVAAAEAVFDDASLLHMPGRSGLAGQYQGGEAILGLLRRMAELTNGTIQFSPSAVLTANDRAIVMYGRTSATRKGKTLNTDEMHVLSLRDGKVREIWIYHQNQDHVDELWTA
jgi:hypothetical protein